MNYYNTHKSKKQQGTERKINETKNIPIPAIDRGTGPVIK